MFHIFLSISLNLIGCQGDKKGKFYIYKKINLLPRNHKLILFIMLMALSST